MSAFDDRLVVITGAGGGSGRATARRFAKRGATVIATDIDGERASETVALVRRDAGCAHPYVLDVSDPDAWVAFADQIATEHGTADVLVNNVHHETSGRFFDHSQSEWDRLLAVNVMGAIQGSRVFARQMIDAGTHGNIVNVTSVAAYTPRPLATLQCTTAAAVLMASECLRTELASNEIGVSAICPAVDSGPEEVATAIVEASVGNPAIEPVGLEARLAYVRSRISPGALRVLPAQLLDSLPRPTILGGPR